MRIPNWLFILGVVLFMGLTAVCSVSAFMLAQEGARTLSIITVPTFVLPTNAPSVVIVPTSTPAPTLRPNETAAPTATPAPTSTPNPLDSLPGVWSDPRRVNILLLGIDQRLDVAEQSENTDTIMIISIDPVARTAGVLSVPRDLWVTIPTYNVTGRINTAFPRGETGAYPGGGAQLTRETIEQNIGVRINYYVLVNFDVFYAVVNTLAPNGVNICVTEAISDPTYPDNAYGTIDVRFEVGCQRLNAERLLQYARTRKTQGGDFDRARRQQEVLRALREEVISAGGLATFVLQLPTLWSEISSSIRTDLTYDELIQLARLGQEIPRENIRFGQIGAADTTPQTVTVNGENQQVLIPRQSAIRALLQDVFSPQQGGNTIADLRARAAAENANIVVYNNTATSGLAGQMRDWLVSNQVAVQSVGNMPTPDNANTTIRDYTGKRWTARYLAALLNIPEDRIVAAAGDGLTSADVMIVVGPDVQTVLSP
jgi:polyisoprenyl-teichoic acid--peptidoglycan teichoic acid transferase